MTVCNREKNWFLYQFDLNCNQNYIGLLDEKSNRLKQNRF